MSVVTVVAKFTQKHFLGIAHSLVSARLPAVGHELSSAHTLLALKLGERGPGQQNLCAKLTSVSLARNHYQVDPLCPPAPPPPPDPVAWASWGQAKQLSCPKVLWPLGEQGLRLTAAPFPHHPSRSLPKAWHVGRP